VPALSAYEVAPLFLIRMAGAPFDVVERLATPITIQAAREVAGHGNKPNADQVQSRLIKALLEELQISRTRLLESARSILPAYLIFAAEGMRERASSLFADTSTTAGPEKRNAAVRKGEQHLLLYLQRIAAKDDTFSEFGPVSWGKVNDQISGLRMDIESGIAVRDVFLERWTAHAVAAVINADPENQKLAVPAMEPYAFQILLEDIKKWPSGAARDRWLSILEPLASLPRKFSAAFVVPERRAIMEEANTRLSSLGVVRGPTGRTLYSALNPIAEECFRESHFEISESLINEVANEAAPWIDFWRDSYAFVASRVSAGLRGVMEKAGAKTGVMPLPAFLQACEAAKLPLTGPGLVAPAVMAFQEVKGAFRKRLQPHVDLNEYELTSEDCHVVRDNFDYPKFDEYTFPSADLQLSATSTEAIARGDYQWILAELHPAGALLHHFAYWHCPDKPTLNGALAKTTAGKPTFHFGFFAADFTAHTTMRVFDALPQLANFVAPQRANPKWRKISPSETQVFIDTETGDVGLRTIGNGQYLGSFARSWIIGLGFHPFQFSAGAHTPRLRCGKVVVQRETWTINANDFPAGNYTGVSSQLVRAIEKLRAEKNLPRFVYIRPTEQALRRSGAEGRDKDTKPVFVDLESYLFLEIFHRWLMKAGEIEVSEMLPDPEHLFWKEPDGRHSFELRTLIVPRS
jgi:hypothetical protein